MPNSGRRVADWKKAKMKKKAQRREETSAGDMLEGTLNRVTAGMAKEEARLRVDLVTLDACRDSLAAASDELLKRRAEDGDRLCQYALLARLDPDELQRRAAAGDKLAHGIQLSEEELSRWVGELLQSGHATLQ